MSDYGSLINPAMPGVISDTGDYNIDGTCFVGGKGKFVMCGKIAWAKIVDRFYKEIDTSFDSVYHIPYGVVLRSQYDCSIDKDHLSGYRSGDAASLVTHGRAWVISQNIDQAPKYGDPVHVARDGTASKGGTLVNGWYYTGGWYKWNGNYFIVEVQINQSAAHVSEIHGVEVNGAVMSTNLESPQPYNKVITFTIDVSPEDATDKSGTWHIADPNTAEIIGYPDNKSVMITSKNYIGKIHVTWVANDGSGVQAMREFEFSRF